MLSLLFDRYKYVALAIVFIVYSVFLWNVSSQRATASFVEKQLANQVANAKLAEDLSTKLDKTLSALTDNSKAQTKELLDELAKDPRYKLCLTTDGVRNAIQRKLDAQPKLPSR